MLFNSYAYIFAFLPVSVIGYFLVARRFGVRMSNLWLVLASLFFYGYWNVEFLPLLIGSILFNYAMARVIMYLQEHHGRNCFQAKYAFWLGIGTDIGALCYFKYMDFFIKNLNRLLGTSWDLWHVVLPLGISFFSITQMVYLIGVYYYGDGKKYRDFINYCLFVSFFPHLLAGPILYHKSMMKQFQQEDLHRPQAENIARGISLFVIGLFKKVIIADALIGPIAEGFAHAGELGFQESWLLAGLFFFEMYFDFSGYTDMAVGAARLMNITIPINFNEPFRAKDIGEFWSRWHMSLTSTITAYIYTPLLMWLGEITVWRSMLVTMVTMVVIGAWHGAGWTFILFGVLQGLALGINQMWKRSPMPSLPDSLSRTLTLVFAAWSCILFRAESLPQALDIYTGMIGLRGWSWPFHLTEGGMFLPGVDGQVIHNLPVTVLFLALWLVSCCHDSNETVRRMKPNFKWALLLAGMFVFSVLHFTQVTAFLYFQF